MRRFLYRLGCSSLLLSPAYYEKHSGREKSKCFARQQDTRNAGIAETTRKSNFRFRNNRLIMTFPGFGFPLGHYLLEKLLAVPSTSKQGS